MGIETEDTKPMHEVMHKWVIPRLTKQFQNPHGKSSIPLLSGDPGCGKTSYTESVIKGFNIQFFVTHLSLILIEELSGIPYFNDIVLEDKTTIKGTNWSWPGIISQVSELAKNGPVVWLLDDWHLVEREIANLGYELFTDRTIKGYKLPDNVAIMLAGNPSAKAGNKKNMSSAIVNRISLLPTHMEFDFWKKNYAIPEGVHPIIVNFLGNKKYQKYYREEESVNPWGSLRSWTYASDDLIDLEKLESGEISLEDIIYTCRAHVSSEAATDFASHYKIYTKVNSKEIFNGTQPIKIPDSFGDRYIYILANVNEYVDRLTNKTKKLKDTERKRLSSIMANIIIQMTRKDSVIGVVGLKDIVITEKALKLRKSMYFEIRNELDQYPDVAQKLTLDIQQI